MTPARLAALTTRALGRKPTRTDLDVWGDALACRGTQTCPDTDCVHDDEADQALKQHHAQSNFPPTAADVRKIAVGLANIRVEEGQRLEREAAVENAVPPTPEYLEARRQFEAAAAARARELDAARTEADTEQAQRDHAARAAALAELRQATAARNAPHATPDASGGTA